MGDRGVHVPAILATRWAADGDRGHYGRSPVAELRLVILVASFVLACAPVLAWRRRDNVLGYLQAGIFIAAVAIPLLGTGVLATYDRQVIETLALVLAVGAAASLPGVAYGVYLGNRSADRVPLTFTRPLVPGSSRFSLVARRIRVLACAAGAALAAGFVLLGYIPLLAASRQLAKYGIGPYAAGFARGRLVYLFALTFAGAVLPAVIVLFLRSRKVLDLVLAVGLQVGLICSLSRGLALIGPLAVVVAVAVERRVRPAVIAAAVTVAFLGGIIFNEVTVSSGSARPPSFAEQAMRSAPDVPDQLNFLRGYLAQGSPENHGSTILANLSPSQGEDGSSFALRMATGILDLSQLAAGGLRLPAPVWGYAAFGLWGAALWSFLSALFAGWGYTKLRRLLSGVAGAPGQAFNLVLAYVVYSGTVGVLQEFYFPTTAKFVALAVAVAVGVYATVPLRSPLDAKVAATVN